MRAGLVVATLVVVAGLAHADRPRLAVVPGPAVNLDVTRVDALAKTLADVLAAELELDAVGGFDVRRQLPADGLADDCVTTPACTSDVARRTNATRLLFVVMVDATGSGAVQIHATAVDPATGATTPRPSIDLATLAEARERFTASARELVPDVPVRVRPAPPIVATEPPPAVVTTLPAVPRHFTRAAYVTGGVAIVGLAIGVGVGLDARGRYRDCEDTPCSERAKDAIGTRALVADVGFVVGIAGLVATGALYLRSGQESRLVVAPTTNGVAAVGRF